MIEARSTLASLAEVLALWDFLCSLWVHNVQTSLRRVWGLKSFHWLSVIVVVLEFCWEFLESFPVCFYSMADFKNVVL